jgi:periplasmic protein TonB
MFDQTFVDTHAHARRPWTMAASLLMQIGVAATLLIMPLLHPEMLRLKIEIPVWVPLKPLAKELPPEAKTPSRSHTPPTPRVISVFAAPPRVPRQISMDAEAPQFTSLTMAGPSSSADRSAVIPGLSDALPVYTPPPAPPLVKKIETPKGPTHVSSGVQAAKMVFGPRPLYPALARAARLQGTVKIQAVISPNGTIQNLSVMSGPPLLIAAALDAVRRWRYQPTLLNGEPVEVATEIDVNFTLSQ